MGETLVSVIIPSFKMGQFIGEALQSVGAQTYPHWEVIVVDDAGPEDGTRAAVDAFAVKHPDHRVEYIRHGTNQGVSVARRTALQASRGEYIAFLDADDAFLPEKLAKHIALLEKSADVVLVHGPVQEMRDGGPAQRVASGFDHAGNERVYSLWEEPDLLETNKVCNSTVLCRRAVVDPSNFPNQMVFQYEDWLLWLLIGERGKFAYCPEKLTLYRFHQDAFTSRVLERRGLHDFARIEMLLALFPRLRSIVRRKIATKQLVSISKQIMLGRRSGEPGSARAFPAFCWSLARSSACVEMHRLWNRLAQTLRLK